MFDKERLLPNIGMVAKTCIFRQENNDLITITNYAILFDKTNNHAVFVRPLADGVHLIAYGTYLDDHFTAYSDELYDNFFQAHEVDYALRHYLAAT